MRLLLWSTLVVCSAVNYAAPPPKPLVITNVELHNYEDGPAMPPDHRWSPGDTVFVSFHIDNYQLPPEGQPIQLTWQLEARDGENVLLVPAQSGDVKVELAPEDKKWQPKVRGEALLPSTVPAGTCRFLAVVKDLRSNQEVRKEIPFPVTGKAVESSKTAVLRNVQFLRKEDDTSPLTAAVYHPGDSVWVRFDITGYRFGPKNRMQLEYGLSLKNSEGKVLFAEPKAASEIGESFYPRRYLPGVFSLNLPKTAPPGEYTLVISLRDGIANQAVEIPETFRVE